MRGWWGLFIDLMVEITQIDKYRIGNYYGGLAVKSEDDKSFWAIENYDGYDWVEIPRELYDSLIKHNNQCADVSSLS